MVDISLEKSNQQSQGVANTETSNVNGAIWGAITEYFNPHINFDGFAYMTPEALIEFVELNLKKVDSQLFSHMKDIEGRRKLVEQLNTLAGEAKALTGDGKGIDAAKLKQAGDGTIVVAAKDPLNGFSLGEMTFPNTPEGKKEAEAYAAEWKSIGGEVTTTTTDGDPAKAAECQQLVDKYEQLAKTAADCGKGDLAEKLQGIANDIKAGKNVSKETLEDVTSSIEAAASELTSSADMTMLKMQTVMQDRTRILTWITNAIKSMSEPLDQMARNIG